MSFFILKTNFIGLVGINREFYVSVVCSASDGCRKMFLQTFRSESIITKLFPSTGYVTRVINRLSSVYGVWSPS